MPKNKLLLSQLVIAAAGLIDSLYLSWLKYFGTPENCIEGLGDCWSVNTSRYSEVYGIPVAVLGTLAYLAIIVVLFWGSRQQKWQSFSSYFVFGMALSGTMYSAYLTYVEFFVIRAVCPFCVVSAIAMLLLLVLSIVHLLRIANEPNP